MWNAFFQAADYQAIKPEILVTVFGLAILLLDFLVEKREKYLNAVAALIGLGFAAYQLADRKSTRLNSSHGYISYAVFCLKKKKIDKMVNRGVTRVMTSLEESLVR